MGWGYFGCGVLKFVAKLHSNSANIFIDTSHFQTFFAKMLQMKSLLMAKKLKLFWPTFMEKIPQKPQNSRNYASVPQLSLGRKIYIPSAIKT